MGAVESCCANPRRKEKQGNDFAKLGDEDDRVSLHALVKRQFSLLEEEEPLDFQRLRGGKKAGENGQEGSDVFSIREDRRTLKDLRQAKTERNELKKTRKREEEVKQLAENNEFSQEKERIILKTLAYLSEMPYIESKYMEKYTYNEIRCFLQVTEFNAKQAAELIRHDIEWRNNNLPVRLRELEDILKSEKVYLYGADKHLNPCFYLKPNHEKGSYYPGEDLELEDYERYLIYVFEKLHDTISLLGFSSQYVVLLDMNNGELRMDLLEMIERLTCYHYPNKIAKIHIVRYDAAKLPFEHKRRLKEKEFFADRVQLYDENYKTNLLRAFDPYELSALYGGFSKKPYDLREIMKLKSVKKFILSMLSLTI